MTRNCGFLPGLGNAEQRMIARSPVVVEPQAWRGLQFRCFPTQASLGWSRNQQHHAVAGDRVVGFIPTPKTPYPENRKEC